MERPIDPREMLTKLDEPWAKVRPELIAQKYARMAADVGAFVRGSAPLFFTRLREEAARAAKGPLAELAAWLGGDEGAAEDRLTWCAGDVHMENFGAWRDRANALRFGVNDFDDAVVAPLEVDLVRLLTSVLAITREVRHSGPEALAIARTLVDRYARAIARKHAPSDPSADDVPAGPVRDLLDAASDASRKKFLDRRAPFQGGARAGSKGGHRAFVASDRYRPLRGDERERVIEAYERAVKNLGDLAKDRPEGWFRAIDIAARVAGLGSLGVARYAIIVEGKGAEIDGDAEERAAGNVLLELKEAKPASLARDGCPRGPTPRDEADRVVEGQSAMRGERALAATRLEGRPAYLRRLSHVEQRAEIAALPPDALGALAETEGRALGCAHARGREALGKKPMHAPDEKEQEAWIALAARLAGHVEADYLAFAASAK